jgi:hypothetical protein
MLNKTNIKMENVNYYGGREKTYLYDKKEKNDSKKVDELWGILARVQNGKFIIPFERKEEFDSCTTQVDYNKLEDDQRTALHGISNLIVHKYISAFDYIFPEDSDVNELVYLVSRGNKNYLVNNEGFSYSRYIVEIINF